MQRQIVEVIQLLVEEEDIRALNTTILYPLLPYLKCHFLKDEPPHLFLPKNV